MRWLIPCALIAVLSAAPASAEPHNLGRLHNEARPTAQSVKLALDPTQENFSGSTHIDLAVSAAVDTFQFNLRTLTLTGLALKDSKGKTIATTWTPAPYDRVTVKPAKALKPGKYALDVAFNGPFDTKAQGLYRLKAGDDWYAFTQMESDDARQSFPCWDEPEFKIPWTLEITAPKSCVVVGNTPVAKTEPAGDQNRVTFEKSPPMPSYLVAFMVGPFESAPIPGMKIPARIYTVKGQIGMTGTAAEMTPQILAAVEKYFGSPYPYAKLDLIAVPEYNWGAMENPGAITFAERVLVMDPKAATDQQRLILAVDIAHELAHMWFGDLVTMEWWDDLWLNESFAEWMGNRITDEVYPKFNIPLSLVQDVQRAYREDNHTSTHAMRQPVNENTNLQQLADVLAYQKGEAVLDMIENWIGPETFRKGVLAYLEEHKWKNARGDDLWNALSKAAGKDLTPLMTSYLDQPGVATVMAEVSGTSVKLSQRRYVSFGEPDATPDQRWTIPMVLRFSDGTKTYTQRVLLTEASQTVALEPAITPVWLHPNADEVGYYHWNVTPEMMAALSGPARATLSDRERLGLIMNLGTLLQAGTVHADDFLSALGSFGNDPAPEVVQSVVMAMRGVRHSLVTPDLVDAYAAYIRRSLRPAIERYGDTPKPGDSPSVLEVRPMLMSTVGVDGHDDALVKKGQELTAAYLANPESVDPSIVDASIRLAASRPDTALYSECQRRFEGAKTPDTRRRFLSALGAFRDPALVDRTLAYMLDGPLRPQELFGVFRGDNPTVEEKMWPWAEANFDRIAAKIPPVFRPFLPNLADGCTEQRKAAATAFFSQPEHAPLGTEKSLAQVVERISSCVSMREREGARVAKMLNQVLATQ